MAPRRAAIVALLSGVALSFAYPEADLAPLAWVAIAPLLVVTRGASWGSGARLGFLFGVGFFGSLLVWVSIVGWVAWAILVVYQSAFIGAFAAAWAVLSRDRSTSRRVALAAALWAAFEFIRAAVPVFGFPWGQLAQSQHDLLWMLRVAGLGGGLFLGFIVVAINALIAESVIALRRSARRHALIPIAAAIVLVLAPMLLP
ncbi:MAG: apolipoprotein N-acyltransferase, partial [Actinomycetota bacterium]